MASDPAEVSRAFIDDLQKAIPEVAFDHFTRVLYSTDASIYQIMPLGVAFPRNRDEIAGAMEIAARHTVPVLPRGGGSSLAGQAVNRALVLDFTRYMDQILEIDVENSRVHVQAGATLGSVNKAVGAHGLTFGPDPASGDRATVGGVLANNATGAHSIRYGMAAGHTQAVHAVLSDASFARFDALTNGGEWADRGKRPGLEGAIYRAIPRILDTYAGPIATHYPKTWRHVAGYNLQLLAGAESPNPARLIVGSEGTLGLITSAWLELVPQVKHKRLALVHFSTLRAALETTPRILELNPAAIELLDKALLDLTRSKPEYREILTLLEGDPAAVLIVEVDGQSESELESGIDALQKKLSKTAHPDAFVLVADPLDQAAVWYMRKVGLGILMSVSGDAKPIPFIEDAAVPVEHLADYVERVFGIVHGAGVERIGVYAHASAGCLHIRPFVNLKTGEGLRQLREIAESVASTLVEFGGTISGEHGQGIARGEFSPRLFGSDLVQAFREVKAAFDPAGLLNPGRVIDSPRMDDASLLRFGPDYATPYQPKLTLFNYGEHAGFAAAVEMCNGAGVCRKLDQGVMCPSFRATRDEANSTRGRANALRAAMMGRLGPEGMTSRELYDVLDLCLSCKACKNECPSSVDMARLKAEFLQGYYDEHHVPLRSWLFGNIATFYRLGQPIAPLTNILLAGPGALAMKAIGVHPERSMPSLARQTFSRWYRRRQKPLPEKENLQVVFFHDTFMEHEHPAIGKAAVAILEAAGCEVIIPYERKCCGRPLISKGLVRDASRLAQHNIELLAPYAQQGIPIVGVEPSCMAMLVDEYPALVPGPQAEALAAQTMLFETFIVQGVKSGNIRLKFDDTPRQVLLHGHCQQKALFGTADTHAMLKLIPNCTVEEIETGCCGMAGSFGYEAEHYELSITLAEMDLAPAVRAAGADTIIAAPGTSCREQIDHTTGRTPTHPIEILADALVID